MYKSSFARFPGFKSNRFFATRFSFLICFLSFFSFIRVFFNPATICPPSGICKNFHKRTVLVFQHVLISKEYLSVSPLKQVPHPLPAYKFCFHDLPWLKTKLSKYLLSLHPVYFLSGSEVQDLHNGKSCFPYVSHHLHYSSCSGYGLAASSHHPDGSL